MIHFQFYSFASISHVQEESHPKSRNPKTKQIQLLTEDSSRAKCKCLCDIKVTEEELIEAVQHIVRSKQL